MGEDMPDKRLLILGFVIAFLLSETNIASASFDIPGYLSFRWFADELQAYEYYPDLPQDSPRYEAEAFFSSDASQFGPEGVYVWAGFELESPDGPRYGILLLDLDLTQAPLDGETPIPVSAIRAEYIEKWGDTLFFEGITVLGDVWITDLLYSDEDQNAIEGEFAFLFSDPSGQYPGSRGFLQGRFASEPSPATIRKKYNLSAPGSDDVVYVSSGCYADTYVADDQGCDCGGEDPEAEGGCEGDTADDSGCEGDNSGSSSGCEGDSGGCDGGDANAADCGGGSSGGGACATISSSGKRHAPLKGLMRLFPLWISMLFIVLMKRAYKKL
jgi:hypothetical protein